MNKQQASHCVRISDETLTNSRRARDRIVAASALLQSQPGAETLRELIGESRAILDGGVDSLERFFAVELERQRKGARVEVVR
jgi:hypothetical protein